MRALQLVWLLCPLFAVLFHFTSGETLLYAEASGALRKQAFAAEQSGRFQKARQLYSQAENAAFPTDFARRAQLHVDTARCSILLGDAFEGIQMMERLIAQPSSRALPKTLKLGARATCALGLYYAAYALRLDNPAPEMWQQEAAEARELFRKLHVEAMRAGLERESLLYARNLEATIQLERNKLGEIALNPPPPASLAARDKNIYRKKLDRIERGS